MSGKAVYNFAKGHPPSELLPNGLLAQGFQQIADALLANVSAAPASHLLQYCPGRGAASYRDKLARFITRQASDGVEE